jgi:hypothetical protein
MYIVGDIPADVLDNDDRIYPEEEIKLKRIGLIKYDPTGKLLWYKIFEGGSTTTQQITIDDEENIYIGGSYSVQARIPVSIDSISSPISHGGVHDFPLFFAKFDKNGTTKFVKYLGEGSYGSTGMNDMQFDNVNKVLYSTGYFGSRIILGRDTLLAPIHYSGHYFLCQMDKTGKLNWATQALSSSSDGKSLCIDKKGAVYVVGNYRGENISISNIWNNSNSSGDIASFIAKYTNKGQVSWIKHFDPQGIGLVNVQDIKIDQSSNMWIAGNFSGSKVIVGNSTFQNTSSEQNKSDIFIAKYNTGGEVIDAFHFGGKGGEVATRILPSSDKNSVYLAGYFYDNTPVWKLGNSEFEAAYYNSFFCEMKEDIVGIQEIEKEKINLKVYPNPATQGARIHFQAQAAAKVQISITDISGKIIDSFPYMAMVGQNELSVANFASYPMGVLFCTLKFGSNGSITEKIVKY